MASRRAQILFAVFCVLPMRLATVSAQVPFQLRCRFSSGILRCARFFLWPFYFTLLILWVFFSCANDRLLVAMSYDVSMVFFRTLCNVVLRVFFLRSSLLSFGSCRMEIFHCTFFELVITEGKIQWKKTFRVPFYDELYCPAVRIQQTNQVKVNSSSINQSTERFTMKVYAWLIDLMHCRKNCPTGMISGWVRKVTEHRGTISVLFRWGRRKNFAKNIFEKNFGKKSGTNGKNTGRCPAKFPTQ